MPNREKFETFQQEKKINKYNKPQYLIMSKIITTPLERFDNLPDYNFSPNYLEIEPGLRMHYLDEGSKDDPIVLLLHGEPSWSYLYRKMIPILVENNFRAIAPDLIGFGKSDKYVEQSAYTYQKHLTWMNGFIDHLGLTDITLFCQDWGGLLGLRIAAERQDLFARVVASNTTLPTGEIPFPEAMLQWQAFAKSSPDFNIGQVINMGTTSKLSSEIVDAYNAPFPTEEYKGGARIFPSLVPSEKDDPECVNNRKAWQQFSQWEKPFLTIFGDSDPIMLGAEKYFQKVIPGTKGQQHQIIHAGHFIQEDQGELLAEAIVKFCKAKA